MFTLLYVLARFRRPSVSLNALTGHRACAPEDCSAPLAITPQGRRRLQAPFRRASNCTF